LIGSLDFPLSQILAKRSWEVKRIIPKGLGIIPLSPHLDSKFGTYFHTPRVQPNKNGLITDSDFLGNPR
jgi:hypothetical protein